MFAECWDRLADDHQDQLLQAETMLKTHLHKSNLRTVYWDLDVDTKDTTQLEPLHQLPRRRAAGAPERRTKGRPPQVLRVDQVSRARARRRTRAQAAGVVQHGRLDDAHPRNSAGRLPRSAGVLASACPARSAIKATFLSVDFSFGEEFRW